MTNQYLGNMPYLLGFVIVVGFLLLGGSLTFCWFQYELKNVEPQPDLSVLPPVPPPPRTGPSNYETRPPINVDSDLDDGEIQIDDKPSTTNRPLGVSLITVTTFGPSETVNTELW